MSSHWCEDTPWADRQEPLSALRDVGREHKAPRGPSWPDSPRYLPTATGSPRGLRRPPSRAQGPNRRASPDLSADSVRTVDKEPRPALPSAPTVRSRQTGFPTQTQASSSSTTPKRPFPPAAAGLGQPKSRVNSQQPVGSRVRLRGGRGHVGGL